MKLIKTVFLAALVLAPTSLLAADGSWDGNWVGRWGGKSSASIRIKDNKVVAYYFNGNSQSIGATKVSGNKISFGSGYSITLTKLKNGDASGHYKGNGTATATLVKR